MIRLIEIAGAPSSSNQAGFIISSEADLANLPTTKIDSQVDGYRGTVTPMSYAVTNDGRIFVLGDDDQWREW